MSNGYLVASSADVAAANEIGEGFGLDVIDAATIGDPEAFGAALASAANVGLILSNAAAADAPFVALMQAVGARLLRAQLILIDADARAAFPFLPTMWPAMSIDDARTRATMLLRQRGEARDAETPTGDDAAPPAPAPAPEPAPEPEPSVATEQAPPAPEEPTHTDGSDVLADESEAAAPSVEEHHAEPFGASGGGEDKAATETAPPEPPADAAPPAAEPAPESPAEPEPEVRAEPEPPPPPAPTEADAPPLSEPPADLETAAPEAPPAPAGAAAPAPAPQAPPPKRAAPRAADAPTAPADATAFAPKKLRRGTPELVRIVVHQPKDLNDVIKAAKKIDPRTEPAPSGMPIGEVALGASIGVALEVRGAACDGTLQRRVWGGEPIDFAFSVEADPSVKQVVLLARVFIDDAQIGVLAFTRNVSGPAKKPHSAGDRVRLKRHKRVFLSYSSKDRETVAQIATAYQMAGVEHFWDRASLKSGEEWHPRLRREIDRADLFHLCWSRAASESEWVKKEAEHAMTRRKRNSGKPDITVQMLDGPPWAPHPPELDTINFDDFVRAAIVGYARGDGAQ